MPKICILPFLIRRVIVLYLSILVCCFYSSPLHAQALTAHAQHVLKQFHGNQAFQILEKYVQKGHRYYGAPLRNEIIQTLKQDLIQTGLEVSDHSFPVTELQSKKQYTLTNIVINHIQINQYCHKPRTHYPIPPRVPYVAFCAMETRADCFCSSMAKDPCAQLCTAPQSKEFFFAQDDMMWFRVGCVKLLYVEHGFRHISSVNTSQRSHWP